MWFNHSWWMMDLPRAASCLFVLYAWSYSCVLALVPGRLSRSNFINQMTSLPEVAKIVYKATRRVSCVCASKRSMVEKWAIWTFSSSCCLWSSVKFQVTTARCITATQRRDWRRRHSSPPHTPMRLLPSARTLLTATTAHRGRATSCPGN